jgi:hypothetical protein
MEFQFAVGDTIATFRRSAFTGRAELTADGYTTVLASPMRFSTQFTFGTRRTWQVAIAGHDVCITKIKPRFYGGLRANTFVVTVDGEEVASVRG